MAEFPSGSHSIAPSGSGWPEGGRHVLRLLLVLIPLASVVIGFLALERIDRVWRERSDQDTARTELEALTLEAAFSRQMARAGRSLRQALTELPTDPRLQAHRDRLIAAAGRQAFAPPFPAADLMVFSLPAGHPDQAEMLVASVGAQLSRRAASLAFASLVCRHLGQSAPASLARQGKQLVETLFGVWTLHGPLALLQRGIPTPVIFRRIPQWLVWDFTTLPNGGILGFFALVPIDHRSVRAGLQLALLQPAGRKGCRRGFVRFVDHPVGDLLPKALGRSPQFGAWRKSLGRLEDHLQDRLRQGLPWGVPVGPWKLYSAMVPDGYHLGVVLLPAEENTRQPRRFFLPFLLLALLVSFGAGRSLWSADRGTVSLGNRFIGLYLLTAFLPMTLYALSALAFLQESRQDDLAQLELRLTEGLKEFDAGKEQLEGDYRTAFQALNGSTAFRNLIRRGEGHEPAVLDLVRNHFHSLPVPLPLVYVGLYDLGGKCHEWFHPDHPREVLDNSFRFFRLGTIQNLRAHAAGKIGAAGLPPYRTSEGEKAIVEGYESGSGYSIRQQMEHVRNVPFYFALGRHQGVHLHEYPAVDGVERFVLLIGWSSAETDRFVLQRSVRALAGRNPDIWLTLFRSDEQGVREAVPADRHVPQDRLSTMARMAGAVTGRQSPLAAPLDGATLVAFPSQRFQDLVFVAGVDHAPLRLRDLHRRVGLILGFLLAAAGAAFFGLVIYRRIIDPIRDLKAGLDQVAAGRLNEAWTTDRKDELGDLSRSFLAMREGLQERERLASLLSAQAVEALSTGEAVDGILPPRSLTGVILVSDIRDFTTLCERERPVAITGMLNRHFAEMAAVIMAQKGRLYKFIGDAIQAVFEEIPGEAPATRRALHAGVALLDRLDRINADRRSNGAFPYRIGLGLAHGPLGGGGIGSQETRLDYALIGPPLLRATALETASKQHPSFPLVFDATIARECRDDGWDPVALPQAPEPAWVFPSRPALPATGTRTPPAPDPVAGGEPPACPVGTEAATSPALRQTAAGEGSGSTVGGVSGPPSSRAALLAIGLFFLVLAAGLAGGAAWQGPARMTAWRSEEASARAAALLDRFRKDGVGRFFLEERMEDAARHITDALPWRPGGPTPDELRNAGEAELQRLRRAGVNPSRFVLTYVPRVLPASLSLAGFPFVVTEGLAAEDRIPLFHLLLHAIRRFAYGEFGEPKPPLDNRPFESRIQELVGTNVLIEFLEVEFLGRLATVVRRQRPEWMFWQPLYQRTEPFRPLDFGQGARMLGPSLATPTVRVVGFLMVHLPRTIGEDPDLFPILPGLGEVDGAAALVGPDGRISATDGFPRRLLATGTAQRQDAEEWAVASATHLLRGRPTQIWTAVPIAGGEGLTHPLPAGVLCLGLLCAAWVWFRAAWAEEGLAHSLPGQIHGGLLAAALLPIVAVLFLAEWFGVDQFRLLLRAQRLDLIQAMESLERRSLLQRPLAWNNLRRYSRDPDLTRAIADMDRTGGNASAQAALASAGEALLNRRLVPDLNQTSTQMIIAGRRGWCLEIHRKGDAKTSREVFSRLCTLILEKILTQIGPSALPEPDNPRKKLQDEMVLDIGLNVLRAVFGEQHFFTMANGIGLPVKFFAQSATIFGLYEVLPDFGQADHVLTWLYNSVDNRAFFTVFRLQEGRFALSGTLKTEYGYLSTPKECGPLPAMRRLARWVVALNLPVSGRIGEGAQALQVEARAGVANRGQIFLGAAAEAPARIRMAGTRRILFSLLGLALAAVLITAMGVSRDLLAPLQRLAAEMARIRHGDLAARLPGDRQDELGELFRAFNAMTRGLQEREVMGRMVSRQARGSTADRESALSGADGERRSCTILAIGVPGFNTLLTVEETRPLLEELRRQTAEVCEVLLEERADVDKIIGEKLLAVLPLEEEPREAGEHLSRVLNRLARLASSDRLPLPLAVGVHTGPVIWGFLGFGSHRDFTVIGDAVNTAARIESLAESRGPGAILVSGDVAAMLPSGRNLIPQGEVTLKGKALPVPVFRFQA